MECHFKGFVSRCGHLAFSQGCQNQVRFIFLTFHVRFKLWGDTPHRWATRNPIPKANHRLDVIHQHLGEVRNQRDEPTTFPSLPQRVFWSTNRMYWKIWFHTSNPVAPRSLKTQKVKGLTSSPRDPRPFVMQSSNMSNTDAGDLLMLLIYIYISHMLHVWNMYLHLP